MTTSRQHYDGPAPDYLQSERSQRRPHDERRIAQSYFSPSSHRLDALPRRSPSPRAIYRESAIHRKRSISPVFWKNGESLGPDIPQARGKESSSVAQPQSMALINSRSKIHSTISKDLTGSGDALKASQLAELGQKLSRGPSDSCKSHHSKKRKRSEDDDSLYAKHKFIEKSGFKVPHAQAPAFNIVEASPTTRPMTQHGSAPPSSMGSSPLQVTRVPNFNAGRYSRPGLGPMRAQPFHDRPGIDDSRGGHRSRYAHQTVSEDDSESEDEPRQPRRSHRRIVAEGEILADPPSPSHRVQLAYRPPVNYLYPYRPPANSEDPFRYRPPPPSHREQRAYSNYVDPYRPSVNSEISFRYRSPFNYKEPPRDNPPKDYA